MVVKTGKIETSWMERTLEAIATVSGAEEVKTALEVFIKRLTELSAEMNYPVDPRGFSGRLVIFTMLDFNEEELERMRSVLGLIQESVQVTDKVDDKTEAIKAQRQFEKCVKAIAAACDGAGFNKFDTSFGKWIAAQFENEIDVPVISKTQAQAAHKMMCKYRKQLDRNDLELPDWSKIEPFYQIEVLKSEKRVELKDSLIYVYTTKEESHHFKPIGSVGFDWDKKVWQFKQEKAIAVLEKAEELGYHIALACQQIKEKAIKAKELKKVECDRLRENTDNHQGR
ncbi:MAG: hypothetical protein F6K14_30890 [Symploca sp. SIO2C1]|nr:hypothetical protein [Symploca sp. SIO2C1]